MAQTLSARRRFCAVLAGGFLGALARALLSPYIQAYLGKGWPYDILLINLTGAFLLACLTNLADAAILLGPTRRLFITVGFLGAYTTFSSLMLGDLLLFFAGKSALALLYLVASIVGGLLSIVLGDLLGRLVVRNIQWGARMSQRLRTTHTLADHPNLTETALKKRGLFLEYVTLGWNVIGVIIVMITAFIARSVALAGFGLDSLIEIFASMVVVWQLTGVNQKREQRALQLISIAFLLLALYILAQLSYTFLTDLHPLPSVGGIVWLALTFFTMLLLSFGKHVTGKQLKNEVLLTEGKVTLVDAYLAGAVLIGLLLNGLFGWWWADPLASLVIIYYGFKEGIHAWNEAKRMKDAQTSVHV